MTPGHAGSQETEVSTMAHSLLELRISGVERTGVCHRCGWRGATVKIARTERRALPPRNRVALICPDCALEVLGTPEPSIASPRRGVVAGSRSLRRIA